MLAPYRIAFGAETRAMRLRDPRGAASLRYRNRAKIMITVTVLPFLCVSRSPIRYGFCAGVNAIGYSVTEHSPTKAESSGYTNHATSPLMTIIA